MEQYNRVGRVEFSENCQVNGTGKKRLQILRNSCVSVPTVTTTAIRTNNECIILSNTVGPKYTELQFYLWGYINQQSL
jgi:hypothetical protein